MTCFCSSQLTWVGSGSWNSRITSATASRFAFRGRCLRKWHSNTSVASVTTASADLLLPGASSVATPGCFLGFLFLEAAPGNLKTMFCG